MLSQFIPAVQILLKFRSVYHSLSSACFSVLQLKSGLLTFVQPLAIFVLSVISHIDTTHSLTQCPHPDIHSSDNNLSEPQFVLHHHFPYLHTKRVLLSIFVLYFIEKKNPGAKIGTDTAQIHYITKKKRQNLYAFAVPWLHTQQKKKTPFKKRGKKDTRILTMLQCTNDLTSFLSYSLAYSVYTNINLLYVNSFRVSILSQIYTVPSLTQGVGSNNYSCANSLCK